MKTWGISTVSGDANGNDMRFAGYVIHKAETAHEALQFSNALVTGISYLVDEVSPLIEAGLIEEDYDHLINAEQWEALKERAKKSVISRLTHGGES